MSYSKSLPQDLLESSINRKKKVFMFMIDILITSSKVERSFHLERILLLAHVNYQ